MKPGLTVALTLLLAAAPPAHAADWSLRLVAWDSGGFDDPAPEFRGSIQRRELALGYCWKPAEPDRHPQGFRYVHQALLIRSGEPAHNGYLHQFDWRRQARWQQLTGEMTLGVHATSNMFKHADFHRDALIATAAAWLELPAARGSAGLAGDYRFGHFQLYPRWRLPPLALGNTELRLDLPVELSWGAVDGGWRVGLERYGDKWATLDGDRRLQGKLYLREWRLGGRYRLATVWQRLELALGAGVSLGSRVDYHDLQAGARSERLENRWYASVEVRW